MEDPLLHHHDLLFNSKYSGSVSTQSHTARLHRKDVQHKLFKRESMNVLGNSKTQSRRSKPSQEPSFDTADIGDFIAYVRGLKTERPRKP
jgi:hypothetical protein